MKPDNKNKKKNTNPLYVVTNNGQDVEPVSNLLDAFITKYGLRPAVDMFNVLLDLLLAQVKSFALFIVVKEFIDSLIEKMSEMKNMLAPVLSFL